MKITASRLEVQHVLILLQGWKPLSFLNTSTQEGVRVIPAGMALRPQEGTQMQKQVHHAWSIIRAPLPLLVPGKHSFLPVYSQMLDDDSPPGAGIQQQLKSWKGFVPLSMHLGAALHAAPAGQLIRLDFRALHYPHEVSIFGESVRWRTEQIMQEVLHPCKCVPFAILWGLILTAAEKEEGKQTYREHIVMAGTRQQVCLLS